MLLENMLLANTATSTTSSGLMEQLKQSHISSIELKINQTVGAGLLELEFN